MPKYPSEGFASIKEARIWVGEFVHWYNHIHLHSGLNFITPYQRHTGKDKEII
jgi:transposase InsO family protein